MFEEIYSIFPNGLCLNCNEDVDPQESTFAPVAAKI